MRAVLIRAAIVTVCATLAAVALAAPAPARISPQPRTPAAPPGGASVSADRPHPVLLAKPYVAPILIVRSGDTLSKIARSACHRASFWTAVWWANRAKIHNPNAIYPGERLRMPACHASRHARAALDAIPAPPPPPAAVAPATPPAGAAAPAAPATVTTQASYSGGSGFEACVISRESGGNPQVMNSTGHYGLFQFSASTWAAYGGNPADFGNASPAEQQQVFDNAMATPGGASNWSPYDGC